MTPICGKGFETPSGVETIPMKQDTDDWENLPANSPHLECEICIVLPKP